MTPLDTYYTRTRADAPLRPAFSGTQTADVAIIGGGLAGLNTALGLAERGVKNIAVLEAQTLGWGASGRNGGFVDNGFSRDLISVAHAVGTPRAQTMAKHAGNAVELIRHRITTHAILCDKTDGILYADWFDDEKGLREKIDTLNDTFNLGYQFMPRNHLRDLYRTTRYYDGVFKPTGFHMHALNYALGLARVAEGLGVRLHETSPVTDLRPTSDGYQLTTPDGQLRAGKVVVCCSGHIGGLFTPLSRATLPVETYVMLTEPLGDRLASAIRAPYAVSDTRFAPDYYRPLPDGRLLWGGRIATLPIPEHRLADTMRGDMLKVYPQLADVKVELAWRGIMGYATHMMPQIGELQPGLWYNMGHGGHGLGTTTMAGELVAAGIAHGDTSYAVFAPFGLAWAWGPAGQVGVQLMYWWYQALDDIRERLKN